MPESAAFYDQDNLTKTLKESDRSKVAELISQRFSNATTQIQKLIEDSRDAWDFYLHNKPNANVPQMSKGDKIEVNNRTSRRGLRLGLIPRSVDSVLSILTNSLFPSDERFFRGTPQNPSAMEFQEMIEQFMADNFAEANITQEMRKLLLTLLLDSAAACAVQWKQKKRKKVVYEAKSIELAGIKVELPVLGMKKKTIDDFIEWEGSSLEPLDFNDWRVDPTARCIEDSWFIRRWYEPVWKVKRDYNLKKVDAYHTAWEDSNDANSNMKRSASGLADPPIKLDSEDAGKEDALLMACYDDFIIDGELYENHIAVTLNGKELIWFGPNPYHHGRMPYIVTSLIPIPNQIYGMSLINHAIPSAGVVDTAVDKIMKIGHLAAEPIFEVDATEAAFKKAKRVTAGMTFPVRKPNSIRQVPIQVQNLSVLLQIIEKAEDNIREVTGASPLFTGEDFANSPSNITAFQVDQHLQGANSRFQAMMNNFSNVVLEQFCYMAFENFKQFKEKDEFVPVGMEQKELTVDILRQCDFKWLITSANAANTRGKRLANIRSLLLEIMPPLVQGGVVKLSQQNLVIDQQQLLREMLVLGGVPNADELLKSEPMEMMNGPLQPPVPGGPGQAPAIPEGQPGIPAPQGAGAPIPPVQ